MARNSEKAMTTLARWRAAQAGMKERERRPFLATDCEDLHKAEKWRRQIIGEVSRKVAQIQNAGLGEFRLRDLNDEINKLLREKGHWEDRIKELNGPDYRRIGPRMLDHEGKEVPGNKGYKYFGAAKELPGVKELFEQEPPSATRRTRADLMKDIDADYYGYRDEDDGVLVPLEQQQEKLALEAKLAEWTAKKEAILRGESSKTDEAVDDDIYCVQEESDEEMDTSDAGGGEGRELQQFIAHVPVPSQKEIEEALVHRKKMELLQKYASESLQAEAKEAKTLMGL